MTPRERVLAALRFATPDRAPRHAWIASWAHIHMPEDVRAFERRWSADIGGAPSPYRPSSCRRGDMHAVGVYTDEWGCRFDNIQAGVIGEVKQPTVPELARWRETVRPPWETLPLDLPAARRVVDEACAASDRYMLMAACPRPWERYQFLRGTAEAMADLAEAPDEAAAMIAEIHRFYVAEMEFWASTAVDGLFFMDDWGAQKGLLISPRMWRRLFKPLYADYCRIAHDAGKQVFMHSDGDIVSILPDLVEVGVDALNSQLGCMDLAQVAAAAKGRMTFWGEVDRQHALPAGAAAVRAEVPARPACRRCRGARRGAPHRRRALRSAWRDHRPVRVGRGLPRRQRQRRVRGLGGGRGGRCPCPLRHARGLTPVARRKAALMANGLAQPGSPAMSCTGRVLLGNPVTEFRVRRIGFSSGR